MERKEMGREDKFEHMRILCYSLIYQKKRGGRERYNSHHKNLYENLMGSWRGINDGVQGGGYEILLLCRKETKANACRL